ncbi:MAG: UDPglucose--hexose-phosphate uridylyltransferase [Acidimicrobiia bacterium]|jgi:UDPglucose--hexose-1-phosphate uridylyltransferase|nr:UDPglucose--hexose-phosphate uridylyltransferase [Acidimicrobiia bacterium]
MSELRFNPMTGRWVTIAAERRYRPGDFMPRRLPIQVDLTRPCPFCPGNEEETPPALETYGPHGRWLVRVVPNLYPAFSGRGSLDMVELGPLHRRAAATGIHEVVVFSPDHGASWADLSDVQAGLLMAAIRDRVEDHAVAHGVEYTQFIVNHGREAGASIEHPHGQLLGIPFVPGDLEDELNGFRSFGPAPLLVATVEEEERLGQRVVAADDRVVALCPYWSGQAYEILLVPREPVAHVDRASPADLVAVGRLLRDLLVRLRKVLGDVAYNIVLHSAPHRVDDPFHWHVHVLPQLITGAGFEQGTGVRINVVPPELVALQLCEAATT